MSDEFEREEKDFDPTDLKKGALFDDAEDPVDDALLDPSIVLPDEEVDEEDVVDDLELYEADIDEAGINESYSY